MLIYLILIVGGSGFLMGNIEFDIRKDNTVEFVGTYGFQGMGRYPVMMHLPEGVDSIEVIQDGEPVRYLPFGKSGLRFFLMIDTYSEFQVRYILKSDDKSFSLQLAPFQNFKGALSFIKIEFTFPETFETQCNFDPDEVIQYNGKNKVCILLEDFTPSLPLQINWSN